MTEERTSADAAGPPVRDLLILGTYPHAVEMSEIVCRINRQTETWNLVGLVSPWEERVGEQLAGLPVLGEDALDRYPTALVVPEFDWPRKPEIPKERLATLVDPSTFVSHTARVGAGCVIYPNCFVGANARLGDLLFCLSGAVINHDDVVGDRVTLTSGVTLAGEVQVEADCYLGQACTVRERLCVGRGSLIGMGAVVVHSVAPNSVMVGNPARRLGARELDVPGVRVLKRARNVARQGMRAVQRGSLTTKAG